MDSEQLLLKLTKIASIHIEDKDKPAFAEKIKDLNEFGRMINELAEKDVVVKNAAPLFNVQEWLGNHLVNLRNDQVIEKDNTKCLISSAPDSEDVFIAVPKVIE